MKIGIIGTGNIATFLLDAIAREEHANQLTVASIYGRNIDKGYELSSKYNVSFYDNFQHFLESGIDLVAEAATVQVVKEMGEKVLLTGKDLIVSSVGAFADPDFYAKIKDRAKKENVHIYIPSGAIGGIDAINSANALGELSSVSLTTRKPPVSLGIAEHIEEKVIYEGSAEEAIQQFPKNINVSIILSLAGIGAKNTSVTIISDPNITKNTHTIHATGAFGSFRFTVENESMPANRKTSYLAALSILSVLKNRNDQIKIGS